MFTQITLLCPLSSLVSVHQFFSPNTRFLLPRIYNRQDVVDTNVTWYHSRPFESAGNLGSKTTHRHDIGRRPKWSPVEDGYLKQQKSSNIPQDPSRHPWVRVPNVVLTFEPMPVLRSEPPHDEFVPESFKDAPGVHWKQQIYLGFFSKCLKVVNEELHLTLWLPVKLRKLGHVEP